MIIPAHRLGTTQDLLVPLDQAQVLHRASDLRDVPDPEFRAMLDSLRFGRWRIVPELATLLWHWFDEESPELALEFGSGLSTLVLAYLMARRRGGGVGEPCRVVTIEQSRRYIAKTRSLLEMFHLEDHVAMVHAPVSWLNLEGHKTWCYAVDKALLEAPLAGRLADFVLIDGPASCRQGRPRSRFGTLPLAKRFVVDGARFVLDDAMRDAELAVVRQWRSLPYVEIDGVIPVGNGVLAGRIRCGPQQPKVQD